METPDNIAALGIRSVHQMDFCQTKVTKGNHSSCARLLQVVAIFEVSSCGTSYIADHEDRESVIGTWVEVIDKIEFYLGHSVDS